MKLLIISDYDCTTEYNFSVYDTDTKTVAAVNKNISFVYDVINVFEALCKNELDFINDIIKNVPEIIETVKFYINTYDDILISRDGVLYHLPKIANKTIEDIINNMSNEDYAKYLKEKYKEHDVTIEDLEPFIYGKKSLTAEELSDLIDEQQNG